MAGRTKAQKPNEPESEGLDRTELESIKRVFERLDRKNDGKIDRDEIAQQFDILGSAPASRRLCLPPLYLVTSSCAH
eukprot:2831386-Rhodomonas_salina.3